MNVTQSIRVLSKNSGAGEGEDGEGGGVDVVGGQKGGEVIRGWFLPLHI